MVQAAVARGASHRLSSRRYADFAARLPYFNASVIGPYTGYRNPSPADLRYELTAQTRSASGSDTGSILIGSRPIWIGDRPELGEPIGLRHRSLPRLMHAWKRARRCIHQTMRDAAGYCVCVSANR